jgi:Ca2+-transporting ATPase
VPPVASETPDPSIAYRQPIDDVLATLASDGQRGLSDEQAGLRLAQYGPNELATEKPVSSWRRFLAQFRDVLVILLLIATAISAALWAFERDAALPYEAIAIRGGPAQRHDGSSRNRARRKRLPPCVRCQQPTPR